jgi:hypothetical protein
MKFGQNVIEFYFWKKKKERKEVIHSLAPNKRTEIFIQLQLLVFLIIKELILKWKLYRKVKKKNCKQRFICSSALDSTTSKMSTTSCSYSLIIFVKNVIQPQHRPNKDLTYLLHVI